MADVLTPSRASVDVAPESASDQLQIAKCLTLFDLWRPSRVGI